MADYKGAWDSLWWDPEEYAALAQDLTKSGLQFETLVDQGVQEITNLGTNGKWTGYLYNELISQLNEKKVTLEEDADMLATKIPKKISNQAQKQAQANKGNVASVSLASLNGITTGTETEDRGTGNVYIEIDAVETAINNFIDSLNKATEEAKKYADLFSSTIANGLNVSRDIVAMESLINQSVDNVFNFTTDCRELLVQCARDSVVAMNAAADASAEEAQSVE